MKLPNIQILRACAALMIVIYHCGIETSRLAPILGQGRLYDENPWGSGVPIFFAISGFIMVVTSANAFGSASAAVDFMRRRLIRIVPLYWVVTTISLGVALAAPALMKMPPGDYLYAAASYLFWPDLSTAGTVRPLAAPGWTLNLEMLFYVVFAVTLLLPRRFGLSLLFAALGLLVTARVSGLLPGVALNFWGDPIVLGFLFGAAIGIAYIKGVRLPHAVALTFVVLGFAALLQPWRPQGQEDDLMRRLADALPSTMVLIGFALGPQVDARRWLWQPALRVGDASYSLYLVHEFLLRLLSLSWLKASHHVALPLWTFVPVGIAVALCAGFASYLCFEQPVTQWLNATRKPQAARFAARRQRAMAGVRRAA